MTWLSPRTASPKSLWLMLYWLKISFIRRTTSSVFKWEKWSNWKHCYCYLLEIMSLLLLLTGKIVIGISLFDFYLLLCDRGKNRFHLHGSHAVMAV